MFCCNSILRTQTIELRKTHFTGKRAKEKVLSDSKNFSFFKNQLFGVIESFQIFQKSTFWVKLKAFQQNSVQL